MKKEILVIDQDEEVFQHIRDAFENEVISVSHVYTSEEGLFRMRMKNYSLIVMDVALSKKEFDVLHFLLKHRNRVLTYEQIYETVWNDIYMEDKSTIFFHVKQLRRKLGDPELIKTIHGIGFRISNNNE